MTSLNMYKTRTRILHFFQMYQNNRNTILQYINRKEVFTFPFKGIKVNRKNLQ